MNDFPITLKPEDSPAPLDPQAAGIELMALLRTLVDDTLHLRNLVAGWGENPVAVQRRVLARSHECHEAAARALDGAETLMRALRYAREFSDAYYTPAVEVHDGR